MTDSPLFSAVARFLRHLGVERQLSPITLLTYQRQLDALIALADEAGLNSWSQCDAVCIRTSFATPLPPICWSPAAICAVCRSCWVMLTSPPPKSIPISTFNTLPRCTMPRIRAQNGGNNAFLPTSGPDFRADV